MVFERLRCKLPVIANQCAHWCGNPPVERNQETITTKNRGQSQSSWQFSEHFCSIRGIATTSVRTGLAMTENFETKPLNNNSSFWYCPVGTPSLSTFRCQLTKVRPFSGVLVRQLTERIGADTLRFLCYYDIWRSCRQPPWLSLWESCHRR